jgi:hypothetical protein
MYESPIVDPAGRFLIWDIDLPPCLDDSRDIVAFYLKIKLPDREIETGYGTGCRTRGGEWPATESLLRARDFS